MLQIAHHFGCHSVGTVFRGFYLLTGVSSSMPVYLCVSALDKVERHPPRGLS